LKKFTIKDLFEKGVKLKGFNLVENKDEIEPN
jgi:hypothetical protein